MYPKSVLGQVKFYVFGKIKLIITKLLVSIANIKFTNRGHGVSSLKNKKLMNNFFGVYPTQKPTSQKVRRARVYFAEFRQDSCAGHGYFYAGNRISLQEQNQDTRVVSGPLKEMGKSAAG